MQAVKGRSDKWRAAWECLGSEGRLSVIMPLYKLADSAALNVRRVHAVLFGKISFEIIPVDDGSADGTAAALLELARELPEVHPVCLPTNSGKGTALRAGAARARGSHVLLLDGDLDLQPEPVANFFAVMRRTGADIVIGSKMHPESRVDYPWRRRLASVVYYGLVKLLVGLPVRDTQTGMKLFRTEALRYSFDRMLEKRFAFDLEVLAIAHNAGYRIAEAPVELHFGDKLGSLTVRNVRQTMNDTLAVFYRLRLLRYYDSLVEFKHPDPPPSVTVVVACPEVTDMLDVCVQGLLAQDYPDLEVLVLPDTASAREWPQRVREVATGKVRPAEKRNLGIKMAKGEIIAFVDDDAVPLRGWLRRAVLYFGDEAVGGVGGPALTPDDDPYWARLGGRVYANPLVSGAYRRRYVPRRVCAEEDLPSCNLLVRASVLRELGGFDTQHWPGEDTLLCMRIVHELNLSLMYDPWVQVSHKRRPLFGPHLRQIARYARHRGVFARRFPQTSRKLSYALPTIFLLGLVCGPLVGLLHPMLMLVYGGAVAFYLLTVALSALHPRRPDLWLFTALGIVATHIVYGANFLVGVCGARLPSDVQPFDHRG